MRRTHIILDGLQDPLAGQALSAAWAGAGFHNVVDVAGQCAWLAPGGGALNENDEGGVLTEGDVDRAAAIARRFGLEIRDRAGKTFQPDNDLASLHERMAYEYKSRFATAVVFVLPALAMHYAGPWLAGGATGARDMLYPWLFELLLVGWACIAAGWPILWQGVLSLVNRRGTGDLLTSLIVVAAFVPSALGVVTLIATGRTWLGASGSGVPGDGPAFHAAGVAIALAVLGRWLAYRVIANLSGKANVMLLRFGRLIVLWIAASAVVAFLMGWHWGLAFGLLLPPLASLGAINPWSPGWSAVLPVAAFSVVFLLGPGAMRVSLESVQTETAAGFALIMTLFFNAGWRRLHKQ